MKGGSTPPAASRESEKAGAKRFYGAVPTTVPKSAYVQEMFAQIAPRYDAMNRLLSLRRDVGWRRFAVDQLGVREGARIVDVATGTGDLAFEVAERVGETGEVLGVDFCVPMLDLAVKKAARHPAGDRCRFEQGDAMKLSLEDDAFDGAVTGFAMRNVADVEGAFREMMRVVRPGGRVVCLELSRPVAWGLRHLYTLYFGRIVPLLGRLAHGRRGPYDYLPQSVWKFPEQERLAGMMREIGFERVRYFNLTGGIAAVHVGEVRDV